MPAALEVRNISKSFGSLQALDDVSLDVQEKKVTILIGPNGSGKTTLINVIMGYHKPDSGKVIYGGTNVTGWPAHKLSSIGMSRTFQTPALFWKLTVLENLLVAEKGNPGESFLRAPFPRSWRAQETHAVERATRILDLLSLSGSWDRVANTLSGGQMKLLEIGRSLMSGARLVFLDEPVSGVNPTLAHEIFAHITGLRKELGIAFFIVEHRLDIAMQYVDYMHAMAYGRILASGPPEVVISDLKVIDSYLGA